MNNSNGKNIWNRRKGEIENHSDKDSLEGGLFDEEAEEFELVGRIQQRYGVSIAEARAIIRNSKLI